MSNGAQIGGIVGGVIGYFVGAPQLGYMIGSAIGGYVDPQKNYGPRLEDATTQTSTVGGVIPFGYGVFTTAGNVIWADELKEHRKAERSGKGGGQKNYTYTYTRSYAVGVCAGQIHDFIWIKRNGRLAYAADPAALGAAMGWNSEQIDDLIEASNKFMELVTFYYGTDSQMPDSTIVAVEGIGNVSPFRDLAYIVLENDDLTATQGAVAQYEFCVQASLPDVYVTSRPYPHDMEIEAVEGGGAAIGGSMKPLLIAPAPEGVSSGGSVTSGRLYSPLYTYEFTEGVDTGGSVVAGRLYEPLKSYQIPDEAVEAQGAVVNGSMKVALRTTEMLDEAVEAGGSVVGGDLF